MKTTKNTVSTIHYRKTLKLFCAWLWIISLPSHVFALDISKEPMETKIQAAPPNIMFLLDNSGSMDWEFMSPESNGIFDSEYYVFAISDNNFSNTYYALNGTKKIEWKSQWSGYNAIYYNPSFSYNPWPRWEEMLDTEDAIGTKIKDEGTPVSHQADMVTPRSNPVNNSPALNLHDIYYANIPLYPSLVVDNQDGSPYFSTTGTWQESNVTPEWEDSSSYTGTDGDRAVFKPDIQTAADYQMYAYWNCYNDRDTNALIEIDSNGDGTPETSQRWNQRATSSDTPESGVCGEWLQLFNGNRFAFAAGLNGTVSITRDASSDGSSTVADAVAFVRAGMDMAETSIDIRNAHYYAVHDSDEDGIAEPGEVYLVNFEWDDTDHNNEVDKDEVTRSYYQVYDNGEADNHETVSHVFPVYYNPDDPASDDVPDSIQPRTEDEFGEPAQFITDYQDLQNFANWFSFYRKRELTAKAAVALSLLELEWIHVGYHTINSGVSQPVLPIKVDSTNSIIVDNRDNGFSNSKRSDGLRWNSDRRSPAFRTNALQSNDNEAWAQWKPYIPTKDEFTVSAWWPCDMNRDQKAKFTITHAAGTETKNINQRATRDNVVTKSDNCEDSSGAGCCGYWVELGTYTFNQGVTGSVKVEHHAESTGRTSADAVMFEGSTNVNKDATNDLLNILYSIDSSGSTPLRKGLQDIGQYYDQNDNNDGGIGASPYYSEKDGGSCQQAYTVAMTDGFWNGSDPNVGNADNGDGDPYQDGYSNTLADVAMYYYDNDLADNLPDRMPPNNYDKKKTQHMVTFTVSLGRDGEISLDDIDNDGEKDDPGYADDPYFLNADTPLPKWGDPTTDCSACPKKIDDLWHASVNGRGRFFKADDPDTLIASLGELFKDVSSRIASGASVSVNGDELSTGLVLYQSTYESGSWIGDVTAYPINPTTGEILKTEDDILWNAQDKLQEQDWDTERNIITYTGTPGTGVAFRYDSLNQAQKDALGNNPEVVEYLRGNEIQGFRNRTKKLGDIVHSAPLLVGEAYQAGGEFADGIDNDEDGVVDEEGEMKGGTIFVGGNDGMLHAFDAQSGKEKFAYIPLHTFAYLKDLVQQDYVHRFYVDATPYAADLTFLAGDRTHDLIDNDGDGQIDEADEDYGDKEDNDDDGEIDEPSEKVTVTILVGALKSGGKGIYALDITKIQNSDTTLTESGLASGKETVVRWEYPPVPAEGLKYNFAGNQTADSADNDGDGTPDEADEDYSDGLDNDNDGTVDEQGEMEFNITDDDMGYSFSDPFIGRSYKSFNETLSYSDNPWVVIFGNGYGSVNGHAVLYILDAWTGDLIRKIDTGAVDNNGLSTPALIDVDNDRRIDFVYAGDLHGNMWKFDLTDRNPDNWGVAFGDDIENPGSVQRIDFADQDVSGNHDIPQPLFSVSGQPITTAPDVMYHSEQDKQSQDWGYMIIFGTGQYLGETDRNDTSVQSIFGIWDFDTKSAPDPDFYAGTWDRANNSFSNPLIPGVKLIEQTVIDWRLHGNNWLRTLSDNKPHWYAQCADGIDNDNDGRLDEADHEMVTVVNTPEHCIPISHEQYRNDEKDNDFDGQTDEDGEETGHIGWYFDLPFGKQSTDGVNNDSDDETDEADEGDPAGERVIKDVMIREGKAVVISFIPEISPCGGGGKSIIHEMDAADGSRMTQPVFDINDDGRINRSDLIDIGIKDDAGNPVLVPPTAGMHDGILHAPVIVKDPNDFKNEAPRELKILSSSTGATEVVWEKREKTGYTSWREH